MSDTYETTMTDGLGMDMELHEALRTLDPGAGDPGYWHRFGDWVMTGAGPELARRRLMSSVTVSDVLVGWARALVPTAVIAAAFAGVILLRGQAAETPAPMGIEELLVSELEGFTIPAMASPEAPGNPISRDSEVF